MSDTVTIIRACGGKRLAKLIHADGTIENYDCAYRYDFIAHPVSDLDALHRLLHRLLHRPDCGIVWGSPIDPARCKSVRRLAYQCKKTGDAPTLRDAAHSWAALDFDGVERPTSVAAADLHGCGKTAVQRLPMAFHAAAVIVQATASHGIKPGIRVRLCYSLSRPATGAELMRWLRGHVDVCTFRICQPIYTAAPVFGPGASDHLPERITLLPGQPVVMVPDPAALASPAPRATTPMPKPGTPGSGLYASRALASAATRVRTAGIGNRHPTILNEARGLARFIAAGLLTESDVVETLCDSGERAGKPEDEIKAVTAWAMDHPSSAPLPEDARR